jgi:hypothetical protein
MCREKGWFFAIHTTLVAGFVKAFHMMEIVANLFYEAHSIVRVEFKR